MRHMHGMDGWTSFAWSSWIMYMLPYFRKRLTRWRTRLKNAAQSAKESCREAGQQTMIIAQGAADADTNATGMNKMNPLKSSWVSSLSLTLTVSFHFDFLFPFLKLFWLWDRCNGKVFLLQLGGHGLKNEHIGSHVHWLSFTVGLSCFIWASWVFLLGAKMRILSRDRHIIISRYLIIK